MFPRVDPPSGGGKSGSNGDKLANINLARATWPSSIFFKNLEFIKNILGLAPFFFNLNLLAVNSPRSSFRLSYGQCFQAERGFSHRVLPWPILGVFKFV